LIGKISTSQSFDGLFRYLLKPEKQAYIVGGNVISTNASDLSQEFNWIARSRPTTAKPVKHLIIGFAPADGEVSDEIKAKIAFAVVQKLGYTNNQYIAIAHRRNDPGHDWTHEHDHIHIVVNAGDRLISRKRSLRKRRSIWGNNR
jgi:hypothetical protein